MGATVNKKGTRLQPGERPPAGDHLQVDYDEGTREGGYGRMPMRRSNDWLPT